MVDYFIAQGNVGPLGTPAQWSRLDGTAQVFFAGMGAFGADWSYHLTFVHLLEPVPLLMVPVAFVGRLPWGLRLLPLALVFLIGVQYAFANAIVPAAALHPVNGFLILLTSLFIARRAWVAVAKRRR